MNGLVIKGSVSTNLKKTAETQSLCAVRDYLLLSMMSCTHRSNEKSLMIEILLDGIIQDLLDLCGKDDSQSHDSRS